MFCILLYGGYSNHYEIAFPILKELNVHADAFIPTDLVGKKNILELKNSSRISAGKKPLICTKAVWWISTVCGILSTKERI